MGNPSWPSEPELDQMRKYVAEISGRGVDDVRVVVSPYRICPLGAHIDHQGGIVSAMTIDKGILLGFTPSDDSHVVLRSGQFKGEVEFRIEDIEHGQKFKPNTGSPSNGFSNCSEESSWGNYARGAIYALQSRGNNLMKGIIGYIYGSEGLDSSGLSSSAAVGIAYLLAFEYANNISASPMENVEYDRLIENEYLGLKNGILDQSAILLSSYGCLMSMNCKTKEHKLIRPPKMVINHGVKMQYPYQILLVFSGLKQALTTNPGYNRRVAECLEAAKILSRASGNGILEPLLSDVHVKEYEAHKGELDPKLARRAEHYFTENLRVMEGLDAWASGRLEDFGSLVSASGLSSIQNYESGCEPLIQLYEILLKAPGVYGARFSGAGFRGCCVAFVNPKFAEEAASFVKNEYRKVQPELACQLNPDTAVLICDSGDCARVI